jgi:hypothetical protein
MRSENKDTRTSIKEFRVFSFPGAAGIFHNALRTYNHDRLALYQGAYMPRLGFLLHKSK